MREITRVAATLAAVLLVVAACSGGGTKEEPTATSTRPAGPSATETPAPTPSPAPEVYEPPHSRPGPATDKLFFKAFNVDQAPLEFQNGNMDFYLFSLKTAAARELRRNPEVRLDEAPATSISIILNPAPAREGELNPLSIKPVRQAVQSLVDRSLIASDIYQGMALPMITHLSPTDFDFLTVFEQVRGADIRFDPELARGIIDREMTAAGAEKIDGKWAFQGNPIRLKFIIRVEDERRDIGSLVQAQLERAGFNVAPSFKPFADAIQTVYSSDPSAFQWHLYTEGWGRSAPSRYDFATINQMAAPWQGNMPGWREVGFWQYENEELDTLGQRLFTGDFRNQQERNGIYRRMADIALDESVRVWVATVMNSFPVNKGMRGVTTDLVSGPKSARTYREAYIPGRSELTLGNLWVWTERTTWNPVGGFGDLYSSDILTSLYDPPLWNHPSTGIPVPYRATFQVETAGPDGKLSVPSDAVQWDVENDQWKAVGEGIQATSKVTLDYSKYFGSNWHHGQQMTMADLVYPIAQSYELAYDSAKSRIEFALGVTSRPYLDTLRGYRIIGGSTLEVYVDFWHFEEAQIAGYASPAGLTVPWEMLAAMDRLVFEQRRAAYSDTAAARFSVPWISLVMKRDAGLVERTLKEMARQDAVPEGYFTVGNVALAGPEEASRRYQAAIDWFAEKEHLFISNGPFFLVRYDPPAQFAELNAFRDPSYPFHPGDWYLGEAPRLQFVRVETNDVKPGSAAEIKVVVEGPGSLGVQYLLIDPASGNVIKAGQADSVSAGDFAVRIDEQTTSGMQPGLYNLFLAAFSDEVAAVTERKVDLDVLP